MPKKKFTEKQLRLKKYNDIIVKNKKQFKAGQSLTRAEFIELFNIEIQQNNKSYEDVHKDNLKLVAAQNELNLLMRENGLYLRSSNYYQNFHIVDKEQTKNQVIRYSSEVDVNRACTTRLESNLGDRVRAGTWGTYNKVSDDTIKNMSTTTKSKRHENTRIRVKYI